MSMGDTNSIPLFLDSEVIEKTNDKIKLGSFWTEKQRQGARIHEVSYRACFKPQLPEYFIKKYSTTGDVIYDPFAGRGTTGIQANLMNRRSVVNDINPLSKILCEPRLFNHNIKEIENRLDNIFKDKIKESKNEFPMFYHEKTFNELLHLKKYLKNKKNTNKEDIIDKWIRMVATNRLTGHSKGFFSVYTLPPNQAVSKERQLKINQERKQLPEYRNIKNLIFKKSKSLLKESPLIQEQENIFLNEDARNTKQISSKSVKLIVTSPPFLDVVDYANDNWLRFWFNNIDIQDIQNKITILKRPEEWALFVKEVLKELRRVLRDDGVIAFEVGEVRDGKINLDDIVVLEGEKIGLKHKNTFINQQVFTKTSNIWNIKNNTKGTNTNRVVIFHKN